MAAGPEPWIKAPCRAEGRREVWVYGAEHVFESRDALQIAQVLGPAIMGATTLRDLEDAIAAAAGELGLRVAAFIVPGQDHAEPAGNRVSVTLALGQ